MGLLKSITLTNGAIGNYHRIIKVETTEKLDSLRVHVGTWANFDIYQLDSPPIWNHYINLPLGDLVNTSENLLTLIEPFTNASKLLELEPLALARFNKWNEIKTKRDQLEQDRFAWNGNIFNADLISQARIQGAVGSAYRAFIASSPWQIEWRLFDNTQLALSAADMIAVDDARIYHIASLHSIADSLRLQVFDPSKTTVAEIATITWPI